MPIVTFVDPAGNATKLEADPGESVMSVAVRHGVPGIVGECGGNASCATCHVYVGEAFLDRLGAPSGDEEDLLDLGVSDRRPASRLSCQLRLTADCDGLVVHTPERQG